MDSDHRRHVPFATSIIVSISLFVSALPAMGKTVTATSSAKARAIQVVGQQPLRFESLDSQGAGTGFLSRGNGYAMLLTSQSAVISLQDSQRKADVRMTWPGANRNVQPVAGERASGITNYFVGSDRSRWRRNVPSFGKVRYASLYRGIDLVFYGNQQQLEYDFVVAAGGDPRDIRLRFSGEDAIRIDRDGNLVIRAGSREIVQRAPVVYQEQSGTRQRLAGRYIRTSRHEVGFAVGDYDRTRTLYIDPVLTFSSFFGGNANNYAQGVAVDSAGDAYVTGYTDSSTFPTTFGAYDTTCASCASTKYDAFVTKISSTGSLVYSTFVGGDGATDDKAYAIAVDTVGNAYVTGETYYPGSGASFPVVNGFTVTGGSGAFLFKLDSTGSTLLYSTQLRSGSTVVGNGVAVEGSNAYVTGIVVPNNSFPLWPTSGTYSGSIGPGGNYQSFILKIDTTQVGLASLGYATVFGGWDYESAYAVAVNSAGEAYVTGTTTSNDFPVTVGALQTSCGTAANCNSRVKDVFVSKFNASGSALLYSTYVGGGKEDIGYAIAIDGSGNAYVGGTTFSQDFPVTNGALDTSCGANGTCDTVSDAFVLKLNSTGTAFGYSTFLGGGSTETARGIAVDAQGYAYLVGDTDSVAFPVTGDAIQPARAGTNTDAFTSVLNPAGSALAYSSYLGGSATVSGGDKAFGIALDAAGDVWVVGQTDSSDFPTRPGAISLTHATGSFDAFAVKIGDSLTVTAVVPSSGGTAGGPVRVTGTGFTSGATVTFGGVSATSVSVLTPTTISAVRPAHALGTVDVTVALLDGQVATLAGGFTYIAPLTFTDDPLQAQVTNIRAVHITELRAAAAALRSRIGLPPMTWTDDPLTSNVTVVKAQHVAEIRAALTGVYNANGLVPPTWHPATLTVGSTVITAAQIMELRAAALAVW